MKNVTKQIFLTEEQQKIVNLKKGMHLVLAPPGSGKTELLAIRVLKAKEQGYEDDKMICLTFTNRAAKSMQERIEQKYPNNHIFIGNIHQYGIKFLKENHLISLDTSILDEEDSHLLIEEIKREINYLDKKIYNPHIIQEASYRKRLALGLPQEVLQKPDVSFERPDNIYQIIQKYETIKKNSALLILMIF